MIAHLVAKTIQEINSFKVDLAMGVEDMTIFIQGESTIPIPIMDILSKVHFCPLILIVIINLGKDLILLIQVNPKGNLRIF
jgi:hypothetical protein